MEQMEKMKKIVNISVTAIIIVLSISCATKVMQAMSVRRNTLEKSHQAAVCPSLLSISRSARDTLIVMKADVLCNQYVLDSLK